MVVKRKKVFAPALMLEEETDNNGIEEVHGFAGETKHESLAVDHVLDPQTPHLRVFNCEGIPLVTRATDFVAEFPPLTRRNAHVVIARDHAIGGVGGGPAS